MLFLSLHLTAQTKYWVSFKDKNTTTFKLSNPKEFLSENALERRLKYNIPITISDLPVCISYLNTVQNIGVEIGKSSKWLNGTIIYTENEALISQIENLAFVLNVKKISFEGNSNPRNKFEVEENNFSLKSSQELDYAASKNQIEMLKGNYLHNLGFTGGDIEIAVMDNGFPSVDTNSFYANANFEGRIIPVYNFVNNNDSLFISSNGNHGSSVISTMASFKEGKLVGTAPNAKYYLFITEDNANEGLAEEYNWAMAAEMADSILGVRAIISTSLGYSDGFNNAADNHVYADMDGNTTPITIAADLAASKGILVVASAGNEGNKDWRYISAPSDGDSVLCIGAVQPDGTLAGFSSVGPSADNRLKPNVCAQGNPAAGITVNEVVTSINGTSFSCPIISGMAACLWQANPDKSNMEIFYAIEKSAHLYDTPNNDYGYGIPNFEKAFDILADVIIQDFLIYTNPVEDKLEFYLPKNLQEQSFILTVTDISGAVFINKSFPAKYISGLISIPNNLSKGVFYLVLSNSNIKYKSKFVKL